MDGKDKEILAALLREQRKVDRDKTDHDLLLEVKILVGLQNGRVRRLERAVLGIVIFLVGYFGPDVVGVLGKLL